MKKLKAHSLPWAIFIMAIVSLMLSALIMQKALFTRFSLLHGTKVDLVDDIHSSLNYTLSLKDTPIKDSLLLNGPSFIKINKKDWGLFNTISIRGSYNSFGMQKEYITSNICKANLLPNLVVRKARNNISITGNSLLKGSIYLPKTYIERAYVENKTFKYKKLYKGSLSKVSSYKNKFNYKSYKSKIQSLEKTIKTASSILFSNMTDSIENSFSNKVILIHKKEIINLENLTYLNNIIIKSDSGIIIEASCQIENAILLAPYIIINKDFIGKLQVFATDSITISKNVILNFPSSLVLYNSKIKKPHIKIGSYSIINGIIISADFNTKFTNSVISLAPKSEINGVVFSDAIVANSGQINGSVDCNKIYAYTKSSYYEDLILDAEFRPYIKHDYIITPLFTNIKYHESIISSL